MSVAEFISNHPIVLKHLPNIEINKLIIQFYIRQLKPAAPCRTYRGRHNTVSSKAVENSKLSPCGVVLFGCSRCYVAV